MAQVSLAWAASFRIGNIASRSYAHHGRVDVALLHVAHHARERVLHLGEAAHADVPSNDASCARALAHGAAPSWTCKCTSMYTLPLSLSGGAHAWHAHCKT